MTKEFFFYDLETSGLSARDDRIMQFAGQRTDLDFNPIGEPVNLIVKMTDDTLPSPGAIKTTGITPQSTLPDGLTEAELADYLTHEIFTPDTIALGYNTVRFDDEFMRHFFWRNFRDPYEWQWKDGRSRWDLLDVVRLTRALRPEGINWPFQEKEFVDKETGKKTKKTVETNRLELITKENGISHEHAHDALSDVYATIAVAKLIKTHQPKLFDYLLNMRDKKKVAELVNLENKHPFVYASGRYPGKKTTVAFPLTAGRNGNVLVFDLRYNLDELLAEREAQVAAGEEPKSYYPIVKELALNKCPAVAPLSVLEAEDGWNKINLDMETIKKNCDSLLAHPEFAERMRTEHESRPEFPEPIDPESALYDGFLSDNDRNLCRTVAAADAMRLADYHPEFADERLPELLLHYKAKNFPKSLTESENIKWEAYRTERLKRQAPGFIKQMEALASDLDPFIAEELTLWYQSLLPGDY